MIAGNIEIQLMANVARLQRDMNQARNAVEATMTNISNAAARAQVALGGITSGIGISQLMGMVDQYGKFTAQLRLATLSAREYAVAYEDVKRIAMQSTQGLQETGTLYARIANGTRELGLAQKQVAAITETVNLSLLVSGATADEAASAQLQLSQAFAAGALRGEEFNAVNEAAPRLMQALADGIGVPVGALKKMAEEGKITSDIMAAVLPNALEKLRNEAKEVQTISGAFTVLRNSVMEYVGVQAAASGGVSVLTQAITGLANNLNTIANTGLLVAAVFGGKLVASMVAATREKINDIAASRAQAIANEEAAGAALRRAQADRQAALISQSRARENVALVAAEVAADRQRAASAAMAAEQEIVAREAQYVATAAIIRNEIALERTRLAAQINSIGRAQRVAELARLATELAAIERGIAVQSTALAAQRVANEQAVANAAAIGTARIAAARQAEVAATGVAAAATLRMRAANALLTTAMGATTIASTALRGALALVGGPIGAVTLALTLGVTAWALWGNKAEESNEKALKSTDETTIEMIARLDKQIEKLRERNRLQSEEPRVKALGEMSEADMAGLARAKAAMDAVRNGTGEWANRSTLERQLAEVDLAYQYETALQRVRQAQDETTAAASRTRNERIAEWYSQNGSSAQKLAAELDALRKQFGTIPPEMEKLVRAKYEDKGAASAVKKHAEEYASLIEAIQERVVEADREAKGLDKLTDSQKLALSLDTELGNGKLKLSASEEAYYRALIETLGANEDMARVNAAVVESNKRAAKGAEDMAKFQKAIADEARKTIDQATAEADQNERLAATFGLTKAAIEQLELARLEEQLAQRASTGLTLDEIDNLELLIAAKKRSAAAIAKVEDLEKQRDLLKSIEDTAHQTFVSMMDGGKDAATRLKDTFKNIFFDWLYQQTLKKWIINLQGSVSTDGSALSSVASAIGGGTSSNSGGSILGSASSLISAGKTIYSAFSGGVASSMGSIVSSMGNLFGSQAVSAFGTGMGMTSAQAATAAAAYGGSAATGVAANTGVAGGLTAGASFASAIPVIGWIISGMMASNGLYKQGWDFNNGSVNKLGQNLGSGINLVDQLARKLGFSDSTANILSGLAPVSKLFGRKNPEIESSGMKVGFDANGAYGHDYANILEKGGVFRSDKRYSMAADLDSGFLDGITTAFGQMKDATAGFGQVLNVTGVDMASFSKTIDIVWDKDATKREQQVTDMLTSLGNDLATYLVPNIAAFSTSGETAAATLQRLATEVLATDAILGAMGVTSQQAFGAVGLASIEARERLITFAGGLDALATQVDFFNANFLTAEQQMAPAIKSVGEQMAALGYASVTTTKQFADTMTGLAESGALATEAGAKTYAGLLALAPAFKTVADYTEGLAKAAAELEAQNAADAAAKAASIAAERRALEIQLMELTGDAAGALAAQRADELATLDPLNRALQESIYARQDEKAATEAAAQAVADLAQAQQAAADVLTGIAQSALADLGRSIAAQKDVIKTAFDANMAVIVDSITNINAAITKTTALSSLLESTLSGMSMTGTEQATRASAQAQIQAALAIAKAGGGLPDADSIKDALSIASKSDTGDFATFLDYQRDFVRTAASIQELSDLTGTQLTNEQKQLALLTGQKDLLQKQYDAEVERLDGILAAVQQQIDVMNGVAIGVQSIPAAIAAAIAAIQAAMANPIAAAPSQTQGAYSQLLGRDATQSEIDYWNGQASNGVNVGSAIAGSDEARIQALYKELLGRTGEAAGVDAWGTALAAGQSWDDIRAGFMASDEYKKAHGVPGFASGGSHMGGWRVVGENGPELENTGPSRIYSNGASVDLFGGIETRLQSLETIMATGLSRLIGEAKRGADAVESMDDNGVKERDETEVA
jgi:tape measure domain-containing protein